MVVISSIGRREREFSGKGMRIDGWAAWRKGDGHGPTRAGRSRCLVRSERDRRPIHDDFIAERTCHVVEPERDARVGA